MSIFTNLFRSKRKLDPTGIFLELETALGQSNNPGVDFMKLSDMDPGAIAVLEMLIREGPKLDPSSTRGRSLFR